MNTKTTVVLLVVTLATTGTVPAQNFFWSLQGFVNSGAINDDLVINANPSDTGTVFLYYDIGGKDGQDIRDGFDLDFSWDNNGVVGFTAAATFDFDIQLTSTSPRLDRRWADEFGPAMDVSSNSVEGFVAVNDNDSIVDGILRTNVPGILNSDGFDFTDLGYDETANAFLVGSFDFEILSSGTTTLQVDGTIVNIGQNLDIPFNSVTFVVPEPTAATGLAIGCLGFLIRRRH